MNVETVSILLPLLIFFVAFLYASVGHGGASGYLAVMSLLAFEPQQMAGTALVLNVFVSSLAFWSFHRAGHALPKFTWLICAAALPLSFIGGALSVKPQLYAALLAFALLVASFRLIWSSRSDRDERFRTPRKGAVLLSGGAIGLLSGIVGVGGGIFLSPLAILRRWAPLRSVAALSSLFILLNSLTGLLGKWVSSQLVFHTTWPLLSAAIVGGLIGSHLGARKFNDRILKTLLALLLLLAATKLLWSIRVLSAA